MKKRAMTILEVIIWSVIILVAAGTALWMFTQRIEKAPGLVEGFLPKTCTAVRECNDYVTSSECTADQCGLKTTGQVDAQHVENICLWNPNTDACELKTRG